MNPIEVSPIATVDVIPIRWLVLRPGFPRETAIFDGDDLPDTRHLGAFISDRLVGIVSLYIAPCPDRPGFDCTWQLRGMATLPDFRGLGVGKALLAACESAARVAGCSLLWCNARTGALSFYEQFGWSISSDEFDIPTVGPHRRMLRTLSIANPA
jgi:GNAT superfamily N-acetyltransferase